MILENEIYLKRNFPNLYQSLIENNVDTLHVKLIESKTGQSTIQYYIEGGALLVHSKYDPEKEAIKFIDSFSEEVKNYEHVLFYGIGLGYHIEEFMKRHPEYLFSIYEPKIEIFQMFTNTSSINQFPVHRLKDLVVEQSREQGKRFLNRFIHEIQERVLLIVLPSYKQIFKEEYRAFFEDFKEAVASKRKEYYVDRAFSVRWTLNSLINFPKTIQTPNILNGKYKEYFKDRPLIIVSAGPSLEEEYDNLRNIKENKLAYIFAVGSANKALIAKNIMPDAVCTYDPQDYNYNVFATIIEQGIKTVPMIYGTSVGYETLNMYPGPKLHMITSQDTISPYYLKNVDGSKLDFVDDAPTIAAVTFQLAAKLGCNPIIFVGQNLAFKNEQFYAKDVNYKKTNRPIDLNAEDKKEVLLVEDVVGNAVETNHSFNNMRIFLEIQIKKFPHIETINSTKGGAAISGTTFKMLEQLIHESLTKPVVDDDWYLQKNNQYDKKSLLNRIERTEKSIFDFWSLYKEIRSLIDAMNKNISLKNINKLSKLVLKFDKIIRKIITNESYSSFVQPINRSEFQALSIRTANIRRQTNEIERAKYIIDSFVPYLQRCKSIMEEIAAIVFKIHFDFERLINNRHYKFYSSTCGAFSFRGSWNRKLIEKEICFFISKNQTVDETTSVSFRFTGTKFKVIGQIVDNFNIFKVIIDGEIKKSVNKSRNLGSIIYEVEGLSECEHIVEILLMNNSSFLFYGIEIEESGRLLHIDEVLSLEELEKGKRIRCHYQANINKVGFISGLGTETKNFIHLESEGNPDGDFYFIMVDKIDNHKKLIADRNIQNYISFTNLVKGLKNQFEIGGISDVNVGLLQLNREKNKDEWLEYIANSDLNETVNPDDEFVWNHHRITESRQGLYSFVHCDNSKAIVYSKFHQLKTGELNINKYVEVASNEQDKLWGFRPVILI
ncbi:DUF115 domain-containing protein [Bacillus sp. Bva_UNVM-123]|uniref:6-hydroxymethylpterin diphosphokinase MptE-like protein n=1 Tax=Bacillus sp. Bva_UNVM-123 TaxID=2829798 RepID=UPI00391F8140